MDAIRHQLRSHPSDLGISSEIPSTTVLPPTSIRDIIAMIFILSALPQSISCFILITYILSGSSKFLGGKFIVKHLLRRNHAHTLYGNSLENQEFSRKNLQYKSKLIGSSLQAFSINAIILLTIYYIFPRRLLQYLSLLAKSIIASELIGSSSTNSTTITSITSITTTSTTTTTTINNKKICQSGKVYSDNNYFNTHIYNALICFLAVVQINYLMQNWLFVIDFNSVQCLISKVFQDLKVLIEQPGLILVLDSHRSLLSQLFKTSSPFLLTSQIFKSSKGANVHDIPVDNLKYFLNNANYKGKSLTKGWLFKDITHFLISKWRIRDTSIIFLSKSLKIVSIILNYVNLVLCVHVIILTISPILKNIFLLKNYSKSLDHLSNLTPNVPIDFKRFHLSKNVSTTSSSVNPINIASTAEELSSLDRSPIVINVEQSKDEILNINLNDNISDSFHECELSKIKSSSIAAENFETFCITPFTNKSHSNFSLKSNKLPNIIGNKPHKQAIPQHQTQNPNQQSTPNSTTIIDKNLINVTSNQPFWAVLAACKTMLKNPSLFAGETTKCKNNGGRFMTFSNTLGIALATVFIDDKRVIFKVLESGKFKELISRPKGINVKVNNVSWAHMDIYKDTDGNEECFFICIYGLTQLFQYEIDVYENRDNLEYLVAHHTVNTISSTSEVVLNNSPEITSLMTLQSSLISTIENLNQFKMKFKKLKKEENKKISELKRDIDNLKNKISKYNGKQISYGRASGKLKGLQHSVIQLEHEIKDLAEELQSSNILQSRMETNFKSDENLLHKEINTLNQFISDYEHTLSEHRTKLKNIQLEKQHYFSRKNKSVSKQHMRHEDLTKLANDIKMLKKNGIIGKLYKRNKKIQEKYDIILPKVMKATSELQKEFEDFLSNGNNNIEEGIVNKE